MKLFSLIAIILTSAVQAEPVFTELSTLPGKKWLGYFVGFENNRYQFSLSTHGKGAIRVFRPNGELYSDNLMINVEFQIEELMPDGKIVIKQLRPDTLQSAQPATEEPRNLVWRGRSGGDAGFEVTVNEDRGTISLGGRVLDPGNLKKNPVRFAIRLTVPHVYVSTVKEGDAGEEKAFMKKIKSDELSLTRTDGKRLKQSTSEEVDVNSADINGSGIAAAELEFSIYEGRKFSFIATPDSSMSLSQARSGPLHKGFALTWRPDPVKDPQGKARLNISVK